MNDQLIDRIDIQIAEHRQRLVDGAFDFDTIRTLNELYTLRNNIAYTQTVELPRVVTADDAKLLMDVVNTTIRHLKNT